MSTLSRTVAIPKWESYIAGRRNGETRHSACARAGISEKTAKMFDAGDPRSSGFELWARLCKGKYPWNGAQFDIPTYGKPGRPYRSVVDTLNRGEAAILKPRNEHAVRALTDFEFFRRRYFGHLSLPWHLEAGYQLADTLEKALAEGERRFVLLNEPPGSGKTTLLHDFGIWVTARNRALRGANVARTEPLAVKNTARMRRAFERPAPQRARAEDRRKGLAVDAEATLAADFGPFQPEGRIDVWTREAFVVLQADGQAIAEKEPTWASYGLDGSIIGNRLDLLLCDDLVDKSNTRTPESRQTAIDNFRDEVEKRIDDGGLCLVAGQRLHRDDLYRYIRDMPAEVDEWDVPDTIPRKYTHIVYPAHSAERCEGLHGRDAPSFPEGCLLDPIRLPWKVLVNERAADPAKFELIYNQDDTFEPDDALARREWVEAAADSARDLWQLPDGVDAPLRVVTVDPSGRQFWALQAWAYEPDGDDGLGGRRYLLDLVNRRMESPDLLDLNYDSKQFFGVLEEWRQMYVAIGRPLQCVVIENNAAQRYLLQASHVRRWGEVHGIRLMGHSTTLRKLDESLGTVGLCRPQWEFGRMSLPGKSSEARATVKVLGDQACRWPVEPNDQVMGHYFFEAVLSELVDAVRPRPTRTAWRPSWMTQMAGVA